MFPSIHGYEEAAQLLNDPRLHANYHDVFLAAGASQGRAGAAGQRSLLNLNGEEHKRLRSEIAQAFRPRSVDAIRDFARATAGQLVLELPDDPSVDFMQHFAAPYIERTTAQYIGFPTSDLLALREPLDLIAEAATDLRKRAKDFDAGCLQLLDYALDALAARRNQPTEDVLGTLAQLTEAGAIDELFAANLVVTLLSAGLEPTILQLGLALEELSKLPEVWNTIASQPSELALIVEELLRLRSANPRILRSVQADVVQHDRCFARGSHLAVDIAGANHDARRFARPDCFDVAANRGSHLAFGFGPHQCLGASLVRAQLQEALSVLAGHVDCPTVLSVKSQTGLAVTGPLELMVSLRRRT